MDEQHCMRCGEWVDLEAEGYYAGERIKPQSKFHPWGSSYCIHLRCRAFED